MNTNSQNAPNLDKLTFVFSCVKNLGFMSFLQKRGVDTAPLRCYASVAKQEYTGLDGDFALLNLLYPEYIKSLTKTYEKN